jgi:hypothetical protein
MDQTLNSNTTVYASVVINEVWHIAEVKTGIHYTLSDAGLNHIIEHHFTAESSCQDGFRIMSIYGL